MKGFCFQNPENGFSFKHHLFSQYMLKIYQATESQLIEVQKIAQITWPHTFKDILTSSQIEYMMDWMYSLESLNSQVKDKNHVFLLAEENEKYIGYCSYELNCANSGKVKIHKIYLLPDVQGQGVGKRLISEVEKIAKANLFDAIYLNVNRFNNQALQAYLALGFYEAKREVIALENGFVMDDIVMEKKI
ncbi:acetyltransferase [Belliella baltica DSM 15883]|uniref:Acetyltransferase n=1 Tax=Belliella baltica (strain DSM 15883 / CIP 108006 / LMG 21964 / BA134) TaxID=866536 RepID=I3Z842_BELBD|nr:acetyltransferase [Belliella baltica DSM 15883]